MVRIIKPRSERIIFNNKFLIFIAAIFESLIDEKTSLARVLFCQKTSPARCYSSTLVIKHKPVKCCLIFTLFVEL